MVGFQVCQRLEDSHGVQQQVLRVGEQPVGALQFLSPLGKDNQCVQCAQDKAEMNGDEDGYL